jgi:hypothetical protein
MRRLAIERLELDLRGIPHATAEAATRLFGPALVRAMAGRRLAAAPATAIAPGSIEFEASPDANALATRLARHIADQASRSRP